MTDESNKPLPPVPPRKAESHKFDYGRVLVVGGSLGMAGAPAMSAMASLRSGAGLVSVASPRCVQPTIASFCPALMTGGLSDDGSRFDGNAAAQLNESLLKADAVAFGPGLGQSPAVTDLTRVVADAPTPLVIDADGLNALARLGSSPGWSRGPRVLTPHAGEFARLNGEPLADPTDDACRRDGAAALAQRLGGETILVLKGPRTVVTDGERFAFNATGNPGMATAGSGDVLTGVLAALIAQGLPAFDAARLAVHAHGLAGDLAAAKLGEIALTATDLIDHLPDAWRGLVAA